MENEETITEFIRRKLRMEHLRLGTWEAVGKEYNRPKGSLWRIAMEPGYCPHWLRENIKRASRSGRDLYTMSTMALQRALEERKEVRR